MRKIKYLIAYFFISISILLRGESTSGNLFPSLFILSPILNSIDPSYMQNKNPMNGNFKKFSLLWTPSQVTYDHKKYDKAITLKIIGLNNILFDIYFRNDIAIKITKKYVNKQKVVTWERNFSLLPKSKIYPPDYIKQTNQAYLSLLKQGDFLSYFSFGKNNIEIKNLILDQSSSVIFLKIIGPNILQTISISNNKIYNIALGKNPTKATPYGQLFVSVTMKNKFIVSGLGKLKNEMFDCSFFQKRGLKHYMTGSFNKWKDVIIWNETGTKHKILSYKEWVENVKAIP